MILSVKMRLAPYRMALSMLLISAWLVLLFSGWALGGFVYLLLIPAAWLFPWKDLRATEVKDESDEGSEPGP